MKRKPRYITVEEHMEDDVNLNIKLKKVLNKGIITIIFVVLAFSIIFSFISYTLVLSKENDLLKLHKQTSLTQMENVEVKSKVEFARSLYNVESKAASLVYLHKPDKVIEISANNADIMVNVEITRKYSVEVLVASRHLEVILRLETLYFSMPATSGKGWTAQPMKLVSNNLWYIRVKLNDVANQRFRFDIGGQGTKGQVYGDKDVNGVLDLGGTPVAKSGKGYFIIKVNDKSMKYSVIAQ